VYMAMDGLIKSNNRAAAMMMPYIGCLRVSMKVFFDIVNNLFIRHYRRARAALFVGEPHFHFGKSQIFHNSLYTKIPLVDIVRNS